MKEYMEANIILDSLEKLEELIPFKEGTLRYHKCKTAIYTSSANEITKSEPKDQHVVFNAAIALLKQIKRYSQ